MDKIDLIILKKMIKKFGSIELKVKGVSMQPLISENETIYIKELSKELKRFDIIVFHQDQKLIVHYFWQKNRYFSDNGEVYLTRPLNPIRGYDIPINKNDILGIVDNIKITKYLKFKIIFYKLFR